MPEGPSPTIDYLVRTLQLNPMLQGDEIIRARTAALGLKQHPVVAKAAGNDVGHARREQMARLEQVRAGIWTMPAEELSANLAGLDDGAFPDIQLAVRRLSTIAQHREVLLNLLKRNNSSFSERLERVLTSNRADATVAKEELIGYFAVNKIRKEGRRTLKRLKRDIPAVYALEAEWLDMLYAHKRLKSAAETGWESGHAHSNVSGREDFSYRWLWVVIVLLVNLLRLLMSSK